MAMSMSVSSSSRQFPAGEMSSMSQKPQLLKFRPSCWSTESYGLVLIAVSAFFYSSMGAFVRLATQSGIPSTEMVFVRAAFQGSLVFVALFFFTENTKNNSHENLEKSTLPSSSTSQSTSSQLSTIQRYLIYAPLGNARLRPLILARGAVGGCGFVLYFFTLSALPLGDAVALLSLSPVVTVMVAPFFLPSERRWHPLHVAAALLTVVGSCFIAQPAVLFGDNRNDDESQQSKQSGATSTATDTTTHMDNNTHASSIHINSWGYLTAALGCCTGAGVFILIRIAGKSGAHTLQLLSSWVLFGLIFSVVLGVMLPTTSDTSWYIPESKEVWGYLLACCILGSAAHFLLNFAARHAHPGLVAIVKSSGIVWAYILQILLFDNIPTWTTCGGVLLVGASLALVSLQKLWDQSSPTNDYNGEKPNGESAASGEITPLLVNAGGPHKS